MKGIILGLCTVIPLLLRLLVMTKNPRSWKEQKRVSWPP